MNHGAQTLADLKQEAFRDSRGKKKAKSNAKPKVKNPRKAVKMFSRIMSKEIFESMTWTWTFVSGPMDSKWNRYKFDCQICKGNVSIYGRGAREIFRHYATEPHLRKNQRWRYEQLATEYSVTKTIRHHVRSSDGKILSPYDLEMEYRKFNDTELVDIGKKLQFYEEYMAGNDHMTSSSHNRVRVQTSILGDFLPSFATSEHSRVRGETLKC